MVQLNLLVSILTLSNRQDKCRKLHTAEQGRKNHHNHTVEWEIGFFIQTLEATDAEEKCLLSVVGLLSSIQRQVVNKNFTW